MKIGLIGTGNMSRSLGILWAEQGHEVFWGSRDPNRAKSVAEFAGHNTQSGTNDEAAEFGEVIFYSVRGVMPSAILSSTESLSGKVILDCNNRDIPEGFAYGPLMAESLAEELAADIPNAHVIKAFNTMAQEVFELSPQPLKEHQVSAYVCGDHPAARQTAMTLASEIGFNPIDCGPLRSARLLESLGDFIRFMIGGMKLGPYATLSVNVLPSASERRLGGRQPSS
ncbi:NAD(P)-binding domain-containing protein [Acaryochloris sp. 'Moss Beach']|uniref:NADPH-dependent F420 reductase n=1 Tax=Acaryochloris sp. 'Moss Beach' TaxID=2740837 RepID=UPI001F1CA67A|nr:NAD(P)-binding domain-containing protein [Acaryochloris sp. 'Moss Beach']UJB67994.1 NAD(P)-binding domain-containing protein [Acaryochloris sp. 'Moss Beach']